MTFTMAFSPSGVEARNSSVVTFKPYEVNWSMMYLRVLASSAEPGGRGPKSNCFLTWSMARSPLKTVPEAAGDGAGCEFADGGVGLSLLGQAAKRIGSTRTRLSITLARSGEPELTSWLITCGILNI